MKIVVAGGTGFIGKELVKRLLGGGHRVIVLSRRVDAFRDLSAPDLKIEAWDGETAGGWAVQIDGADAVINLSGENIAGGRWTPARKKALRDSRLNSTRALVGALASARVKPKVFVNASAVGFYGNVQAIDVAEDSPKGRGFLSDLCAEWENEAKKASASGIRVVLLRIGIVLEKEGGALEKMVPPFKMFAGGPLGSGRQYFPWIHREDVVGALIHAVIEPSLSGPANACAPGVLTMSEFCSELGKALHRPSWAPVPAFVLKTMLGEMADMLLTGQKAVPRRLEQTGYRFKFPEAGAALRDILQ